MVSTFEEDLDKAAYSGPQYAEATAAAKARDVAEALQQEGRHAALVIGADTVVECGGEVLEKPADAADAARMLRALSGRRHSVHTGVALVVPAAAAVDGGGGGGGGGGHVRSFVVTTAVDFDVLTPETIEAYIATGGWLASGRRSSEPLLPGAQLLLAGSSAAGLGAFPSLPNLAPAPFLPAGEPFGKAGSYGIQGAAASFVVGLEGCYFSVVGFPLHRFSREVDALVAEGILQL